MWPYTDDENEWLTRPPPAPSPTPLGLGEREILEFHIARGRRLRAEALAHMAGATARALSHWLAVGKARRDAPAGDDVPALLAEQMRAPLTAIRSSAKILRDNPHMLPKQRRHLIEIVIAEDRRLTKLIDQILGASKVEAHPGTWQIEVAKIAAVRARATN
jgi:signal transduction histidine kinase